MIRRTLLGPVFPFAATVVALLAIGCGASKQAALDAGSPAPAPVPATTTRPSSTPGSATAAIPAAAPAASAAFAAATSADVVFSGTREETERFIRYFQEIRLSPEQERVKVEALSTIPAPCCSENPLSTCCCPCNMAKAAWGLSAWLITEKGQGVDGVRQATRAWLAAANPAGFTGNACKTGGCARPIHQNGCGGMNAETVL